MIMRCLVFPLLFHLMCCSELYKYKLIDSQEHTRRSDSFGPGPYLQKDSFFKSGFLGDLFGYGRPEASAQVKRENNVESRYPYHGRLFSPSPTQNTQHNKYSVPSPFPNDPRLFTGPFYPPTVVKYNEKKHDKEQTVDTIKQTLNPYTYKVIDATNPKNIERPSFQVQPVQKVYSAYGHNIAPISLYPSTPKHTHSNIVVSQYQSTPKPHHNFSYSSSQYENTALKLDQFFTVKPFVHKVKTFVNTGIPEKSTNIGQIPIVSISNNPQDTHKEAPIFPTQPVNYNVIQERHYLNPETFQQIANQGQHSTPYVQQQKYPGQYNLPIQLQPQAQYAPEGPSMESLLSKIDINSQIKTPNEAITQEITSNIHSHFSNGVKQHSNTQQTYMHNMHPLQDQTKQLSPHAQQNQNMLQLTPHTKTTISKPEQLILSTDVNSNNNHQVMTGKNKKSLAKGPGNEGNNNKQSFNMLQLSIGQQNIDIKPNEVQLQSFIGPKPQQPSKDISHGILYSENPTLNSYSLLQDNAIQTSFQEEGLPNIDNEPPKLHPFIQKTKQPSPELKFQPLPRAQPLVQNQEVLQHIGQSPHFNINPVPSTSNIIDSNSEQLQELADKLKSVPNYEQQTIQILLEQKPAQMQTNLQLQKESEIDIGTTPRFVYNTHGNAIPNSFNMQFTSLPSQYPNETKSTSASNSNSFNSEELFHIKPSTPVTNVHQRTSFNKEMSENSVDTSKHASKNLIKNKRKENTKKEESISHKKPALSDGMHVDHDNTKRPGANEDLPVKSLSKQKTPKNPSLQQLDNSENSQSKTKFFTSFPMRAKITKNRPINESSKDNQKTSDKRSTSSPKPNKYKTGQKKTNLVDKQVNKVDSLKKLLAIAGAGWDTKGNIAKSKKKRFKCPKPEGHFADPENCKVYYRCVHGTSNQLQCGTGLKWNSKDSQCDWEDNVDCGLNRVPRSEAFVLEKN